MLLTISPPPLVRFETTREPVWFKAVGKPNLHELAITLLLTALFRLCPQNSSFGPIAECVAHGKRRQLYIGIRQGCERLAKCCTAPRTSTG
jgi:hypothetical protein